MQSFELLSQKFAIYFDKRHFPAEPNEYFLKLGGKRVRPVLCLMGNELFDEIKEDALHVGTAIELFHNFTLIHDDIMDKAPLRRGMETVHTKYGENTALLAGDVMLVTAYEELNKINIEHLQSILLLFNRTAKEVCEGQQIDMDYEFGRKLGIAFQVQDDYLDAFGDPQKFGKQVGGDILANKKTFLLLHALETATASQQKELKNLLITTPSDKIEKVQQIFHDCKVDEWALELKNKCLDEAFTHLEDIAVLSKRKEPLKELAHFLVKREH